jgi:hypothetical protein
MSNQGTSKKLDEREDIEREASKLLRKNLENRKSTDVLLSELRSKYKDEDIVEAIRSKYVDKLRKVRKLAEKISEKLVSKYPNLSIKEYVTKIAEYKKKYNFDDSEMQNILQIIFKNKSVIQNSEFLEIGQNEMGKALGFQMATYNYGSKMTVRPDEMEQLQSILQLHAVTRELHHQIMLQSMLYEDVSLAAVNGRANKEKTNIFSYVHPVVAALFMPKIKFLDEHMLIASISSIIAKRYEGSHLETQPEYELYVDIATDPSEVACNVDTNFLFNNKTKPIGDLLARVNVQVKLWEAVLNLRQGKYYTNDLSSFIGAIDSCRNSIFDAADFAYIKDEGTILRKLFNAFSIRPIIVCTAPIYGLTNSAPPLANLATTHITTIPLISYRVTPTDTRMKTNTHNLQEALEQRQLYIHKRQITVKTQQVMYCREILTFYVHRRFQAVNLARLAKPYQLMSLPVTVSAYEKLHIADVDFPMSIPIGGIQRFGIKSIVAVELSPTDNQLIIGCSALIRTNATSVNNSNVAIRYNPLDLMNSSPTTIEPVKWIFIKNPNTSMNNDFYSIGKSRGTLFIYKLEQTITTKESGIYQFNS